MDHFRSHIDLAHEFWKKHLHPGGVAIDATCGNGHDSFFIANLIGPTGELHCIDLQEKAIANTRAKLKNYLGALHFHHNSHHILPGISPDIIVYNLGYLPGSDKSLTTQTESTLQSLQYALQILTPGGLISITCYPGHLEGAIEEKEISSFVSNLSKNNFTVLSINWENRTRSPSLILIQSILNKD